MKWLSNKQDKEKAESELRHYLVSWPFERLREILNQEKQELTRNFDYDNPAWSHKQAHINGRLQQIENVLALIGDQTSE